MASVPGDAAAPPLNAFVSYLVELSPILILSAVLVALAATGMLDRYATFVITLIAIYATTTTGLTLFMGYCGQLSIGHAAFCGLGAYVAANLSKLGFPFLLAVLMGGVSTLIGGYLIGLLALRLRGFYLAVMTLAIGLIATQVYRNWDAFTGGVTGLGRIPAPAIWGYEVDSPFAYMVTCLAVFIVAYALANALVRAPIGLAMRAIADSELAAQSIGMNTYAIKVHIFAISTFLAGVSGGLYAHLTRYITPEHFAFSLSIEYLTMVIVGGIGHIMGGVVGTVIVLIAAEELRNFPQLQPILYGAVLLLAAFLPSGAIGILMRSWRFMVGRLPGAAAAPARYSETA